jgi:hypothetical protein
LTVSCTRFSSIGSVGRNAQGQTLDRLVVDLTGGTFSFGQLYVALSRCTSINGLVLRRPVLPTDLKTDRRIARFLNATVSQNQNRRLCAISRTMVMAPTAATTAIRECGATLRV